MSLRIQDSYTVPPKTAEVARAVFPKGNTCLTLFDTFGSLFADPDFAALFLDNGQPALSPVRLMLILILQFKELEENTLLIVRFPVVLSLCISQ